MPVLFIIDFLATRRQLFNYSTKTQKVVKDSNMIRTISNSMIHKSISNVKTHKNDGQNIFSKFADKKSHSCYTVALASSSYGTSYEC